MTEKDNRVDRMVYATICMFLTAAYAILVGPLDANRLLAMAIGSLIWTGFTAWRVGGRSDQPNGVRNRRDER